MKKLLLSCVLSLGLLFGSANVANAGCFNFTLSCGIGGTACGDNVGELIDLILMVDNMIC